MARLEPSFQNNPSFIHHKDSSVRNNISQVVFGLQDGMVSTLGAITGVAVGSNEHYIVLLAGVAIISVESISMGVGEYLSSRSHKRVSERMLDEEREEIGTYPEEETEELVELFVRDGWDRELASTMAKSARVNPKLMLTEMAYRELSITPGGLDRPVQNGIFMFFAYIIGGLIPLSMYFLLPVTEAIPLSIILTLIALFGLGAGITHYTKRSWVRGGAHMFIFGSIALFVGLAVGVFMKTAFGV